MDLSIGAGCLGSAWVQNPTKKIIAETASNNLTNDLEQKKFTQIVNLRYKNTFFATFGHKKWKIWYVWSYFDTFYRKIQKKVRWFLKSSIRGDFKTHKLLLWTFRSDYFIVVQSHRLSTLYLWKFRVESLRLWTTIKYS